MLIEKIEPLTSLKWLNLFAADFDNNGYKGRWVFASRKAVPHQGPESDAVIIVPIWRVPNQPARLVLIREFRVPVGDYLIGLPAGLIDPGDSIEDTARRESLEETGLQVSAIRAVSPPLYSSSGMTDEAVNLVIVDVEGAPNARPTLEASEALEVLTVDYPELCQLLARTDTRFDLKAWMVLWMFQQLGRIE